MAEASEVEAEAEAVVPPSASCEERLLEVEDLLESARRELAAAWPHPRLSTPIERGLGAALHGSLTHHAELGGRMEEAIKTALAEASWMLARERATHWWHNHRSETTWEESEEAALEGVARAIERYDGRNRLSSLATWWILQRLQRTAVVSGTLAEGRSVGREHIREWERTGKLPAGFSPADAAAVAGLLHARPASLDAATGGEGPEAGLTLGERALPSSPSAEEVFMASSEPSTEERVAAVRARLDQPRRELLDEMLATPSYRHQRFPFQRWSARWRVPRAPMQAMIKGLESALKEEFDK